MSNAEDNKSSHDQVSLCSLTDLSASEHCFNV